MSAKIIVRDEITPYVTRLRTELARLARAEIRIGVLGSEDGELLRIARVHEYGMTIRPKTAKNLAIPLKPGMRDKSPREIENTWVLTTDEGQKFIVRDKGADEIEFLFMLVPKVTIPERSFIRAGYDHGKEALADVCKEAIFGIVDEDIDAMGACHQVGMAAVKMIQDYMPTVQPPKSQITLASMPGKTTTLQMTGQLRRSIQYEVIGI